MHTVKNHLHKLKRVSKTAYFMDIYEKFNV